MRRITTICISIWAARPFAAKTSAMSTENLEPGNFPDARRAADFVKLDKETPQTRSPTYKLAFQDTDFLLREDLRAVRFQLELLKPELLMDEAKIGSMFVMYGSARIPEPGQKAEVADPKIAARLEANAHYYDEARKLAQIASKTPQIGRASCRERVSPRV